MGLCRLNTVTGKPVQCFIRNIIFAATLTPVGLDDSLCVTLTATVPPNYNHHFMIQSKARPTGQPVIGRLMF